MKNVRGIGDVSADRLMAPLAVQEMVFAIWPIEKGFSRSPSLIKKQLVPGKAGVQS